MRTIIMIEHKNGRLSGEVLEDGKHWQVPPFDCNDNDPESALLERLDIVQVEAQFEAEMEGINA